VLQGLVQSCLRGYFITRTKSRFFSWYSTGWGKLQEDGGVFAGAQELAGNGVGRCETLAYTPYAHVCCPTIDVCMYA
jgi:hypothetical protein